MYEQLLREVKGKSLSVPLPPRLRSRLVRLRRLLYSSGFSFHKMRGCSSRWNGEQPGSHDDDRHTHAWPVIANPNFWAALLALWRRPAVASVPRSWGVLLGALQGGASARAATNARVRVPPGSPTGPSAGCVRVASRRRPCCSSVSSASVRWALLLRGARHDVLVGAQANARGGRAVGLWK